MYVRNFASWRYVNVEVWIALSENARVGDYEIRDWGKERGGGGKWKNDRLLGGLHQRMVKGSS